MDIFKPASDKDIRERRIIWASKFTPRELRCLQEHKTTLLWRGKPRPRGWRFDRSAESFYRHHLDAIVEEANFYGYEYMPITWRQIQKVSYDIHIIRKTAKRRTLGV